MIARGCVLLVALGALASSTLAAESKPRPLLPGSIAALKAAAATRASSASASRDNQTMTAVLDARRAMLAAANESRSVRPHRDAVEDAVGQGDGDGEADEQSPTASASAASSEDDQGDEHRPQNHRVVDPTAGEGANRFAPSTELGPIPDQYGYDTPTRHIHIHQHHLGATAGAGAAAGAGAGAGAGYTAPSGAAGSAGRRPTSPAQTPGLSHYRASGTSAPSAPTAPSAPGLAHGHHLHAYKPLKFESSEEQHLQHHQQQHYSVHEDQDHHHYHNQQAVHAAIAAAHPHVSHSSGQAGEATGELAVGVGLGAGLSEGLGAGGLGGGGLGGGLGGGGLISGAVAGGDGALQYPLLGAAPYEPPKSLPHIGDSITFSHKPKDLKKGKSTNLWRSALKVLAGIAPLALLVAAISPNVLIIDPRLGTRQRSTEGQTAQQRCEQRAVCEVARASGPHVLQALRNSLPRSRTQAIELAAIIKAVETDACAQFACAEYDARANRTAELTSAASSPRDILVTPVPPAVATTPMAGVAKDQDAVVHAASPGVVHRRVKERKRKKVFGPKGGAGDAVRESSTTETPQTT